MLRNDLNGPYVNEPVCWKYADGDDERGSVSDGIDTMMSAMDWC